MTIAETNLQNFMTAAGVTIKDIRSAISGNGGEAAGNAAALVVLLSNAGFSAAATNLLAAVIENKTAIDAVDLSALIDDTTAAADKTYSSNKITADIQAAVDALVDAAPGTMDQLSELAAAIGNDADYATTVASALALKANIADTYSKAELGPTFTTRDWVADWAAAIA